MSKHSVTIRMGAANWDAEVNGVRFDFRTMNYDQKRAWYGTFMASVRRFLKGAPSKPPRYRRKRRKGGR